MELTKLIDTKPVWSFVIIFFLLLLFIAFVFWLLFRDQFKETMQSIKDYIVQDYDDEPYKPLKKVNDIEVDAEVLDNVPRHKQED